MKTIQCPSCGAAATNFGNCDFCGSLFVRAEQEGYAINNLFTEKLINNRENNLTDEIVL
jgi:phage FluMu protein Com